MMMISDFYCTICGKQGIPVIRTKRIREPGHLKKLYCLTCNKERNFVEIRHIGSKYTLEHFQIEYENGNFDENGERKIPFKQFCAKVSDKKLC